MDNKRPLAAFFLTLVWMFLGPASQAATSGMTHTVTEAGMTHAMTETGMTHAMTETGMTQAMTEATVEAGMTEAMTQAMTQAPVEAGMTEAMTQAMTQAPVEAGMTEAMTQAMTEAMTQAMTEAMTQAMTQAPVEAGMTEAMTQAMTQAPVEAGMTEAMTQAMTQAPVEAGMTEAMTQAPVEAGMTQAMTQAPVEAGMTEAMTEAPVEAGMTQAPVEAGMTEAPVEAGMTQAPVEAVTEATTQAPVEAVTEAPPLTPNTTVENLETEINRTGCGSEQLCIAEPAECDPSEGDTCFFAATRQTNGQNFEFELSGESDGYIAVSLSEDTTVGGNDTTYICANDDGVVRFFGALLDNDELSVVTLNANSVRGRLQEGTIQCTFAATVTDAARLTAARATSRSLSVLTGDFDNGRFSAPETRVQTSVINLGDPNANATNIESSAHTVILQQSLTQALLIALALLGLLVV
ncbi:uncharacterized protein ACBR49_019322 [Aulostomus maculatus]